MTQKSHLPALALLLVSMILSLAGCEPATTESPTSPPEIGTEVLPSPTIETQEPEATPKVIRYGITHEPGCLDNPFACQDIYFLGDLTWEGFTGRGADCEILPRLAESIEQSEDGLTTTIHLREGVTYNDGEPLDANAVKQYWDWFRSVSLIEWYPEMLYTESSEVLDDLTFQFTTSKASAMFLTLDAMWLWPVPPKYWADLDEDALWEYRSELPIVTTGPFILTEWEKGSYLKFEANPDYYLGRPTVDEVIVHVYSNETAMVNALLAGEIDVIPNNISAGYYDLLAADPNITIVEQPPGYMLNLEFNVSAVGKTHPALKDKAVRHAIDLAIDKQKIIAIELMGKGILCPNGGLNCGPLYTWFLDPSLEPTPYDPVLAAQILDDGGYLDNDEDGIREMSDGTPLSFRLYYQADSPLGDGSSRLVTDDLKKIGIGTEVTAMEFTTLQNAGYVERDFDLVLYQWSGESDPGGADYLFSCWSSEPGSGLNFSGYCNPDYDAIVQEHIFTMGLEKRLPLFYKAQRMLADARPEIILAGLKAIGAFRNDRYILPTDACPNQGMLVGWYATTNAKPAK